MSIITKGNFAALFKKYRLKSEFETINDFGDAMAEKGMLYDYSLYSHWQKGHKVPHDRRVLQAMVSIFLQRGGITSLNDINNFFEAASQGYLTDNELSELSSFFSYSSPFIVPKESEVFVGRDVQLQQINENLRLNRNTLLSGVAGCGKTQLAIHVAHEMKSYFKDGVLFYSLNTTSPMTILSMIAYTFHRDIYRIQDFETRAEIVRNILSTKHVLIILDNVDIDSDVQSILPYLNSCTVLITSIYKKLPLVVFEHELTLPRFSAHESLSMLSHILGEIFVRKNNEALLRLCNDFGNLPLGINLVAKYIKGNENGLEKLKLLMRTNEDVLKNLEYENKNLLSVISASYERLNSEEKQVFNSLGMFQGQDFSIKIIAEINDLNTFTAAKVLDQLNQYSLIETYKNGRYILHPLIYKFIETKFDPILYKKAAAYYTALLELNKNKPTWHTLLAPEVFTMVIVFEQCYKHKYLDDILEMWVVFGGFLWVSGYWRYVIQLGKLAVKAAEESNNLKKLILILNGPYSWIIYFTSDISKGTDLAKRAFSLSKEIKDDYEIALSEVRLGMYYLQGANYVEKNEGLEKAVSFFEKRNEFEFAGNAHQYKGECLLAQSSFIDAKNEFLYALNNYKNTEQTPFHLADISIAHTNLGIAYLLLNDYKNAESEFNISLQIEKSINGKLVTRVWNYIGLGIIQSALLKQPSDYFVKAHDFMTDLGLKKNIKLISPIFDLLKKNFSDNFEFKV